MYEKLKSPISIGRLQLKNRVAMPAMGVNLSARDGGVSDDVIAFYEARARGGVGLIITEITRVVDGAGAGAPCQLAARNLKDVPDLQRLVEAVQKYGAKIFIQLQHPGGQASSALTGELSVVPSVVPILARTGLMAADSRELTERECDDLVQAFVGGARIAQMAGADGVELHGAHGYLINEFLSPAMNKRGDKYGGDFERRLRFAVDIVQGIRETCGPLFPISVRINGEEALPGGIDLDEAGKIAAALERAGADAINVSCLSAGCIEPGTYAQGWKKHLAAAVKKKVGVPVIAVCNIKEPEAAERLLAEGVCDVIGVGRGHLADPEWCAKTFSDRADEIRPCIGCLACFAEICKLRRVKCAVSPVTGREREYARPERDGQGRAVAVVGGGPAGIEAALALKERGFAPVIFEEGPRLGGVLNVADKGPGKILITRYVDSLIAQVARAEIKVRIMDKATPDKVHEMQACGVFVACGGAPFRPSIEGLDGDKVCTAEEVILGRAEPTGSVAVIGSGMTGLEIAEMLTAAGCRLTLVEMLDALGPGIYHSIVADVMSRISPQNPRILTSHRLEKVLPGRVILAAVADGRELEVAADWVVLAMGARPRRDIVEEFKAAFDNVIAVGDAVRGGRIMEATLDARAKAFTFNPVS